MTRRRTQRTRRTKRKNPWWSTWPGALGLGASSLILLVPWWVATLAMLLLVPEVDTVGMDQPLTGPGAGPRIVMAVLGMACLALPVLTVRWARKIWLGYTLLGVTLSGGFCVAGLVLLGLL